MESTTAGRSREPAQPQQKKAAATQRTRKAAVKLRLDKKKRCGDLCLGFKPESPFSRGAIREPELRADSRGGTGTTGGPPR